VNYWDGQTFLASHISSEKDQLKSASITSIRILACSSPDYVFGQDTCLFTRSPATSGCHEFGFFLQRSVWVQGRWKGCGGKSY